MKVKRPKSKDVTSKGDKLIGSKTMKKREKKNKPVKHVSDNISENSKDDKMSKRKTKVETPEHVSEGPKKKGKKLEQKRTAGPNGSPSSIQTPNDNKKRKPMKKKKTFNKEAIDNMKAHQLAKKEKLMRQNPTAETPDAKRRRPKLPLRLESVDLKFSEDDDTMAQFDGMWVPREEMGRLQSAREELEKRGLPVERVNRSMKQLVRREHRKLKLSLIAAQTKTERVARERRMILEAQQTPRVRRRVPGRSCGLTLLENEQLARLDGFWVSAAAVPRLEALRKKLTDEGKTENEARRLLRKVRRVEERKVKSSGRLLCTKCGGRGHLMSDCTAQAVDAAAGTACFRCGDAGHRLFDCPKKGEISGLPFATCFLCKQQGHMSRDCPQAPGDAGQKPGKTGQKPVKTKGGGAAPAGGQSWRGLTHDTGDMTAEPTVKNTPPPSAAISKQKASVHMRFD